MWATEIRGSGGGRGRPRGATLVEVLLMSFIGIGLVGVAWSLLRRSTRVSDASSHSLALQVGIRNLLENMARDLAATHMVLPTDPAPRANALSLATYATPDARKRLQLNQGSAVYPFTETSGPTRQQLDVVKVDYRLDPARQVITRTETPGVLVQDSGPTDPARLSVFTFTAAGTGRSREMATQVDRFDLTYVGYDDRAGGLGLSGLTLTDGSIPGLGLERTACLALHLVAVHGEGVWDRARTPPRMEILTKLWIPKRTADEVYREYFSSADEELRY